MKYFWVRFIVFVALWTYSIFQYSNHFGISILFFAGALGVFFFLSLKQVYVSLYILLSVVIVLHDVLITDGNLFTIILLFYVSIVASFRLRAKKLLIYLGINLFFSITIGYIQGNQIIGIVLLSILLYFVIVALSESQVQLTEQRTLYEQLLGEYRKQKRVILLAEQDARTEERNRIARDIHDSVGHRLTALIMKLEMLAIQNKNEEYRDLKKMAEESLDETRHAVKTLQADDNEGIAAVVNLIRKLEVENQIVIQFTIKQGVLTVPLSNQNSVVLYRVIQEALTNAMRHGHSREVQVILGKSAIGDVTFEVSNAVYESKSFVLGFGLINMKKRVEEVNGRLDVFQKENRFTIMGIIPAVTVNGG
ncbi:sensor histidine kinase [Paucisalibacillus globulus]|uniref:sensor histidine kinase n=1 Tax=Paucisalibacillus globulus TaxID=351095 RepID=UPI000BB7835B|nr:sensor histidine kinase [Paucisalibacillus globulus]